MYFLELWVNMVLSGINKYTWSNRNEFKLCWTTEAKNTDFLEVFIIKLMAIILDRKNEDLRIKNQGKENIDREAWGQPYGLTYDCKALLCP